MWDFFCTFAVDYRNTRIMSHIFSIVRTSGIRLLAAFVMLFGLGELQPAFGQSHNEIRSGRIGVEYGKTRKGRRGSQYRSRRNFIMENNSKMGFWSVGVIGGGSMNWQTREAGYAYDMSFSGGWGGYAGVSTTYMLYNWLSVRADLMFVQKNHSMHRMAPYLQTHDVHSDYTNNYIQLPVMADWTFGDVVRCHILTGAYAGFWAGGEVKRTTLLTPDPRKAPYEFTPDDNRYDGGLVGGVGVSWDPWQFLRLGVETILYYSMSNTIRQQPLMYDHRYHNTVVFGLSARYVF